MFAASRWKVWSALGALVVLTLVPAGCAKKSKQITIGLSLDTLREERWQRDRDEFVKHAEELGARVLVQAANNSDALQNSQCENLLTQGIDVLVVAPHNAKSAATIVNAAHKAGVKVIAYDRLITDCDLDLYMSFDNLRVGQMQAEYALAHAPKGNYVLIAGAPTDNNAHLYRDGQLKALAEAVARGDVHIVEDQWANDWLPSEALKIMENTLTRTGNKVDAVVVSNDGLAGGAIQALAEQKLAGRVVVTGQDAELSACQRIVAGLQSMTVYKPIPALARKGAETAIAMAKGQAIADTTGSLANGFKNVPAILITPVAVDRDNMMATVVKDGFHAQAEVYQGAAADSAATQ